ncbi:MAG: alanine--glyoxylate aminotransferase family protein [Bdellovibrionota bacterium]
MKTYTLMTPGPVPMPPEVLEVLALPMEHHRTPEFVATYGRVLKRLKEVFQTDQPCYIQTSTGSGGLESALVNCMSPGDKILAIISGKFGERWAEMAEAFGGKVVRLEVEWGKPVDVKKVEDFLKENPDTRIVMTQACETSTATLHPIRELAQAVGNSKAILMVDAITALGALNMPMDEWGIDVVIGGSQKAFMLPTGLSFISFSKKAWAMTETSKCPKFYFDIRSEHEANLNGESLFSSSVTLIRALDRVLDIFLDIGMHKVHERIQALATATVTATNEMGLKVFSQTPSPSVTAIAVPEGVDGQKVRADIEKTSSIVVMGGQDRLKGKILRIGHMGAISDDDLLKTLEAMANAINRAKPDSVSHAKLEGALASAKKILSLAPPVMRL